MRALESLGAAGVALKWPNDILYRDAKLGGILIELQQTSASQGVAENSLAVIGIGLNLRIPEAALAGEALALPPAAWLNYLNRCPSATSCWRSC